MNIAENVVRSALWQGDRTAVVFEERAWTYRQLADETARAARVLAACGVGRGDRVALFLPNIPAFVFAYYGALRLGAVAVSVNASLKRDEVAYILGDCTPLVTVTTAELLAQVPEASAGRVLIAEGPAARDACFDSLRAAAEGLAAVAEMEAHDPAAILYTSGTTGFPKGAVLSHGNVVSNMYHFNYYCAVQPEDRMVLFLPLFHCFGQNALMNSCFNMAASLVLQRGFTPEGVHHAVVHQGVTMLFAVPTLFGRLYDVFTPEDMRCVRFFFSAAAIMPEETARRWEAKFGRRVYQSYGLTETSPFATFNHQLLYKHGSIGTPIGCVDMKVVDADGREVPTGELGEIVVKGPNVMLGYWNRPEETAAAIVDGWFHTGDMGTVDSDGFFYIVDRLKDMINVAGLKVYPAEVERVLFAHAAVLEAAVYAVPDPVMGERVAADVVLRDGLAAPSAQDLMAYCREHMAAFKVPAELRLVDQLPKNPVGKTLKRVLRDAAAQRLDHAGAPAVAAAPEVDADGLIRWIKDWMNDRMGVPRAEIGADQPFEVHGMTSSFAVLLIEAMAGYLQRPLKPTLLWRFPTPRALAAHVIDGEGEPLQSGLEAAAAAAPAVPEETPDLGDLSDAQMAEILMAELAAARQDRDA